MSWNGKEKISISKCQAAIQFIFQFWPQKVYRELPARTAPLYGRWYSYSTSQNKQFYKQFYEQFYKNNERLKYVMFRKLCRTRNLSSWIFQIKNFDSKQFSSIQVGSEMMRNLKKSKSITTEFPSKFQSKFQGTYKKSVRHGEFWWFASMRSR